MVEGAHPEVSTERIRRKLERIIIPKLEFREATIREAIEFLKKKSQELDVDSPPGERGVNIAQARRVRRRSGRRIGVAPGAAPGLRPRRFPAFLAWKSRAGRAPVPGVAAAPAAAAVNPSMRGSRFPWRYPLD